MDKIIHILKKGISDKMPIRISTRASFIADRLRFEFLKPKPFTPIPGVSMAVESSSKYKNFVLDGEEVRGLVLFFADGIKEITQEQIDHITKWFEEQR